jgi:hypothetical protein
VAAKFIVLKGLRWCPLVLLVKVSFRKGRAAGGEGGKLMGSKMFEYAAGGKS